MDDHRFEHGMMRSGQRVGIVDSSSAVYIRVGEDNNMLIGDSRQRIVDRFHPAGSQITFGIERVEMRVDGSLLPLVCTGDTYAAVGRRAGYGDNIKFAVSSTETVRVRTSFRRYVVHPDRKYPFLFPYILRRE